MARTIIWYVCFWLLQLLSIPLPGSDFPVVDIGAKAIREKFIYLTARTWARLLIGFAGARVEVFGLENLPVAGGMLFVSNHQGAFDIPLLLGYVPGLKGFVAKKEASRLPIVGIWIRLLRCIVLDRKDMRQSARAIARGVGDLRAGRSLIVFPEGTRSKSGDDEPFQGRQFQAGHPFGGGHRAVDHRRLLPAAGRQPRPRHAGQGTPTYPSPASRFQDLSAAGKGDAGRNGPAPHRLRIDRLT